MFFASQDPLPPRLRGLLPHEDAQSALNAALAEAKGMRIVVLEEPGTTLFA